MQLETMREKKLNKLLPIRASQGTEKFQAKLLSYVERAWSEEQIVCQLRAIPVQDEIKIL